jgi:hypothetical protein
MKQPQPCNPTTSILEGDLTLAADKRIVERLQVMETSVGFYVMAQFSDKPQILNEYKNVGVPEWFYIVAQLLAEPGKAWYLTTRRNRFAPKIFKDLMLLNEHLKQICRAENFEVVRGQALPGMPKTKMHKHTSGL